jgi:hypothetical protein
MNVGAPFNPYSLLQEASLRTGFWSTEASARAPSCAIYIRLLGFAGRDARCYPSLDQPRRFGETSHGWRRLNRRVHLT